MFDPLAAWWVHEVKVERLSGTGAYGPVFDAPETVVGFVSSKTRLTRDTDGQEVVSTTTVAAPSSVGFVPPGSKLTTPTSHGGRTALVIACSVGDGGGNPTPDHIEIFCE